VSSSCAADDGRVKAAFAVLVAFVSALAAGCGDNERALTVSSCGRVLYEGQGTPALVVVSDLPVRGPLAPDTRPMVDAIELVLRRRAFRAGAYRVGYQSCNDAVGEEVFDESLCRQNARAFVSAEDVVGIIGPLNSGCAWYQIPIVSRRSAGPLAMVSMTNNAGLTRTIRPGSGASLYPDGIRSYARVVTNDIGQGIAAARVAAELGARRAVVVHQDLADDYVRAPTVAFQKAASRLGLSVRKLAWREPKSYERLAAEVAAARPDAVFFAGYPDPPLMGALRAAAGAEAEIIAPDSFAFSDVPSELGRVGEGLYVTTPGVPADRLPPAGRELIRALRLDPAQRNASWAAEAAQAAEVLLDAIARSDGTRASVVREVYATKVRNGILGSFSFDRFGDIVPAPVTIYRIREGRLVTDRVVRDSR
jgi:branched-chain amino acid transport system substrate-binding protein